MARFSIDGWNSVSSLFASQLTCAHSLGQVPGPDILGSKGLAQFQSNTLAALGKGRGCAWPEVKRVWARAQRRQLGAGGVAVSTRRQQGPEKEHLLLTSPHPQPLYSMAKIFPLVPEGAGSQLLDRKEDLRLGAGAQGWGCRDEGRGGDCNFDLPSPKIEGFLYPAGSGN